MPPAAAKGDDGHRKPGGPAHDQLLLVQARSGLRRLDPGSAFRAVRGGAILVDTRPEWQRSADGDIPGAAQQARWPAAWTCTPGLRPC
jgi:hypothetical protein